ncbi:YtzI protein [Paenisporosarcina indica]|nr:YtzI protein [Paenisporosarcina indica]
MLIFFIIVAILIMIGITLLFMLSTKKAYSIEHTIDPIPTEHKDPSDLK